MQKSVLLLLFFSLCISACQKQAARLPGACITNTQIPTGAYASSTDFVETDYNESICGYLPLSKKNYWIYLDSSFSSSGQFQNSFLDTFRFTKTYQTPDGIIWWSTDGSQSMVGLAGYPRYNYSIDSITYGTSIDFGGFAGRKWFYTIGNSSSQSESIHYSDLHSPCYAQRISSPVQVPAGNFSGCTFFNKKLIYGTGLELSTWYKPGIGVLKTDILLSSVRIRSALLISYHIE